MQTVKPTYRNTPHTVDSLLARTVPDGQCAVWTGASKSNGYGVVTYKNTQTTVHRVMYLLTRGGIDPHRDVHHTCRNRACINPEHLALVTHKENLRLDKEARATCRNGHPWDDSNTYTTQVKYKGGVRYQRYCRACRAAHQRTRRAITYLSQTETCSQVSTTKEG